MVNDEELKAHVKQVERVEREYPAVEADLFSRVQEIESTARCVHNELARRIEQVDATSAEDEVLADLAARIEGIESRLDDIESRLD